MKEAEREKGRIVGKGGNNERDRKRKGMKQQGKVKVMNEAEREKGRNSKER